MTFTQATDEYHRLQTRLSAGQITSQDFEAVVNRLIVSQIVFAFHRPWLYRPVMQSAAGKRR
jgi:hypothetical protein